MSSNSRSSGESKSSRKSVNSGNDKEKSLERSSVTFSETSKVLDERKGVSRKNIINQVSGENLDEIKDETWPTQESLYQDHIEEILKKWEQIDDEIWGKIIYMERNRRIAKAYARSPILSINGSKDGFDGYKIGLNGFDNVVDDPMVKRVKRHIGQGVRIKIEETGDIIIKRLSNCDVFIRGWNRDANCISKEIIDLSGELEYEKSVKLFDMKKFQAGVNKELRSAYPDRRKLESQCVCAIAFVKDAKNILELPVWCLIVNIVALDMLKSKLPPVLYDFNPRNQQQQKQQQQQPQAKLYQEQPKMIRHQSSNDSLQQLDSSERKSKKLKMKSSYAAAPLPLLPAHYPPHINKENQKLITTAAPIIYMPNDLIRDKDPYYYGFQARVCNSRASYFKYNSTPSNGYLNKVFQVSSGPVIRSNIFA